jgi:hypothetical protein
MASQKGAGRPIDKMSSGIVEATREAFGAIDDCQVRIAYGPAKSASCKSGKCFDSGKRAPSQRGLRRIRRRGTNAIRQETTVNPREPDSSPSKSFAIHSIVAPNFAIASMTA